MNAITARDLYGGPDIVRKKRKRSPGSIRKTAVRNADKYASLDIRLDKACVLAKTRGHVCKGPLVCGHLFSRVAYSTRWKEENLYLICSGANFAMENDPKVARQLLEYAESLWDPLIIEDLHRLYESARPVKTWEIQEYAEIWEGKYRKHLAWREMGRS